MTAGAMDERARIAHLAALFAREGATSRGVTVGIGDDAAVLDPGSEPLVWTVDAQVEGTHFRPDWVSWEDVGYRSFMAAASDLAAMGADPVGALSALVLAPSASDSVFDAIIRGQAEASRALGLPVIGGNLARGGETSITTTVLGRTPTPVRRSGARPGDLVFVAGPIGLAAAGLESLVRGDVPEGAALTACVSAWRRPMARIAAGRALRAVAHAAVDVSDGLVRDLGHVCEASGVTAILDEAPLRSLVGAALESVADALIRDPIDLVLFGGEDYALVATGLAPPAGFTAIGRIEGPRADGGARIRLRRAHGDLEDLPEVGFDHFARTGPSGQDIG